MCYGFEGEKRYVSWFRSYLLIASVDSQRRTTISVFDLKNRFIAFSLPLPGMGAVQARTGGRAPMGAWFPVPHAPGGAGLLSVAPSTSTVTTTITTLTPPPHSHPRGHADGGC